MGVLVARRSPIVAMPSPSGQGRPKVASSPCAFGAFVRRRTAAHLAAVAECSTFFLPEVMADDHNAQIAQYLQFLRRKREAAISEVTAEFNETKETRLFDDNYHVDDVVAILDGLLNVVRSDMKRDLSTTSYSSALLLKQCFEQAEEQRITLSTDLPCTEDRRLLGTIALEK